MVEVRGVERHGQLTGINGTLPADALINAPNTAIDPQTNAPDCPLLAKVVANWQKLPAQVKEAIASLAKM